VAGFELDRRALEVVADWLVAPAEMRREERFDDGFEGAAVFGPAEAVAFIAIVDIARGCRVAALRPRSARTPRL
jgi:hypothetical protein